MLSKLRNRKNNIIESALDIVFFFGSYMLAFYLRFDGSIPGTMINVLHETILILVALRVLSFMACRVFSGAWHYAGFKDLSRILAANSIATVVFAGILYLQNRFYGFPRSVLIIDWMTVTMLVGGLKYAKRFIKESILSKTHRKRVLIVGAGDVGTSLINYLRLNWELGYEPVAFVDDDPSKIDKTFFGVKVIGSHLSIPHVVEKMRIDEIIIAITHCSSERMREIVHLCRLSGVPFKTTNGNRTSISQRDLTNRIRNIKIEDLIGRKPIEINYQEIRHFIRGKRVLVTGAAGSIGSELCRQIADFLPDQLIAFDQSENGLFYLQRELQENFHDLDLCLALADITDIDYADRIFEQYKPHLVFHAAAYKHVHMMELNPHQAIKNNIIGTKNMLELSLKHGVKKFIFISTDKAVNPKNFMGMSKRIAEQYVQAFNQKNKTRCIAVRFGNVIGSSGSAVRIFEEQIAKGGPVTVTHPDVRRFFMTIPEAVQLVLQAATKGQGGEIFVLKMGDLIKILDLAKELILLAGKEPGKDIQIQFTGLRPGEKLIEELWEDSEECREDFNENLYIIRNGISTNIDAYETKLHNLLKQMVYVNGNTNKLKSYLETFYHSDSHALTENALQ